jgi:hypothetical protein
VFGFGRTDAFLQGNDLHQNDNILIVFDFPLLIAGIRGDYNLH